jgi:hypothetical protein
MVVRGQVGVVEGNWFAENAREWSPRGAKIKSVFQCLNSVPRGFLEIVTDVRYLLFGPAYFFVSTPPVHAK